MDNKEIFEEFREAITLLKDSKRKTVRIVDLEIFLKGLEDITEEKGEINKRNLERELTKFRAENDRNISQAESINAGNLEMFKAIIQSGQNAVKSALLINGGAGIATLAFIGNIASKGNKFELIVQMSAKPLLLFGIGIFLSALGAGLTYITQMIYEKENKSIGHIFNGFAIASIGFSYVLFGIGVYIFYELLTQAVI